LNFIFYFISNIYLRYETVDINVAISTNAGVLMTPIVYNVDQKVDFDCFSNEIISCFFCLGSFGY
jgi:ABC-type polysaccharide/polyol phosphate export permease